MKRKFNSPKEALEYHVTGAIERGEKQAITAVITKHTPGPWTVDDTWGLIMAKEAEIAACHAGRGGDAKANASLIAAPEMYEAIEKHLDHVIQNAPITLLELENLQDGLKRALTKARGE
jgi:hypothetical protein